ncbi:MAG: LysM peptidoglycan-binding domain-containing protein [Fusobacterium sp.]|nr:LysM peptidoglycan-binding domain-containing protein [Fusobacterium sp.]
MKSVTIRRSNLSKEKMAVLEALRKYKSEESAEFGPHVYIRPDEIHHKKKEDLDLLWKNFKIQELSAGENAPKLYAMTGVVAGILLVAALTMTAIFAHNVKTSELASTGHAFGIGAAQVEEAQAPTTYVVQNGDTIEQILIRFHGRYSKTMEANLLQANNMSNPNKLSIGQQLVIPMN